MIEHPDITNEFAKSHYNELLQEAAIERRFRSLKSSESRGSLLSRLNNWINDLKFWSKPTRRATNRA
ncbi:MAG TPA: hypothetical protein VKY59_17070 [Spirillospora sp.]|nr:hypothetical protein [Spirillospora sp.]